MQYTINNDNDQMYITSDLITDYIAGLPSPAFDLFITVLYNGTQVLNLELTSANLDTANDRYILIPDLVLDGSVEFADGIYKISLTESANNNSENICVPILNDLTCLIINKVANLLESNQENEAGDLTLFLQLLKEANTCADCNCSDALVIYNYLLNSLNITSIINDCGC